MKVKDRDGIEWEARRFHVRDMREEWPQGVKQQGDAYVCRIGQAPSLKIEDGDWVLAKKEPKEVVRVVTNADFMAFYRA